jgi:predicted  nucleic acid-binding Zn-ribbon protein
LCFSYLDRTETLEETVKELQSSLRHLNYDAQQLEFKNQEQLSAANDAIAQWEARCEELTHQIEEVGEQSSEVVNQWKGMPHTVHELSNCVIFVWGLPSQLYFCSFTECRALRIFGINS